MRKFGKRMIEESWEVNAFAEAVFRLKQAVKKMSQVIHFNFETADEIADEVYAELRKNGIQFTKGRLGDVYLMSDGGESYSVVALEISPERGKCLYQYVLYKEVGEQRFGDIKFVSYKEFSDMRDWFESLKSEIISILRESKVHESRRPRGRMLRESLFQEDLEDICADKANEIIEKRHNIDTEYNSEYVSDYAFRAQKALSEEMDWLCMRLTDIVNDDGSFNDEDLEDVIEELNEKFPLTADYKRSVHGWHL